MKECDFSLRHYAETLAAMKEDGFSFVKFDNLSGSTFLETSNKIAILRHDIDKSVAKSLWMAEVESELGIQSTFFLRLHSNYYNPFGYKVYDQVKKMEALGHQIALHTEFYDAARLSGESPMDMFEKEMKAFEAILGYQPSAYSNHRTTGSTNMEDLLTYSKLITQKYLLKSAYDKDLMENFHYLSDSSGFWRQGCFCKSFKRYSKIYILTHADWWFKNAIEYEESLV